MHFSIKTNKIAKIVDYLVNYTSKYLIIKHCDLDLVNSKTQEYNIINVMVKSK